MDASTAGEPLDFPQDSTESAGRQEDAVTLPAFVQACGHGARRRRLLLLVLTLTLAAGWTDALSYLAVGHVFASIMSGNVLFVGLSIAQRNTALLTRAVVALLLFLGGIILGSRSLQMLPTQQTVGRWRRAFACYLLGEEVILLAFALVWLLAGHLARHPVEQVVLLGMAAFGMGLQGALLGAFNILDVSTVALTATELLLGIQLAQWITGRPAHHRLGTSGPFLGALILSYVVAAFIVALTVPWIGAAFMPSLLLLGAVMVLAMPERQKRFDSFGRDTPAA